MVRLADGSWSVVYNRTLQEVQEGGKYIGGVKTVEGNDESLYCHGNLIIPLIKRGMMSDYAHVNHASVSIHNHSSFPS